MISRRSSSPVPVPGPVRSGERVSAAWGNRVRDALRILAQRVAETPPRRPGKRRGYNQLEVRTAHYNATSGSADVTMEPGALQEIKILGEPSLELHPFTYSGAAHLSNTVISVATGQSIWAQWRVSNSTGQVVNASTECEIVVAANSNSTSHWHPDDPEGAGAEGTVMLPLADISISGNTVTHTRRHDGNPVHYLDLWFMRNVGNSARVAKQYDEDNNTFDFRTLLGTGGITVSENGDTIEISPTQAGKDMNLTVTQKEYTTNAATSHMIYNREVSNTVHFWRDGAYVGTNPVGVGPGTNTIIETVDNWTHD